jgi:hypothetical protein
MNLGPVAIQRKSSNRKLAPQTQEKFPGGWRRNVPQGPFVVSTYVSIAATCPSSCAFKGNGCYVQSGPTARHSAALDAAALGRSGVAVIRAEVDALDRTYPKRIPQDGARGGRDLRLHVGGDVSCSLGAMLLAGAAERWKARGGGRVWTYTHRWASIPSHAWGPSVSVLASCESEDDVIAAWVQGYAPSIVVPEFPRDRRVFAIGRRTMRMGLRAVPCPVEAGSQVTCATCRLCMDDLALRRRRLVVAFAAHGPGRGRVHLTVVGER